jgi:hypothetical protein
LEVFGPSGDEHGLVRRAVLDDTMLSLWIVRTLCRRDWLRRNGKRSICTATDARGWLFRGPRASPTHYLARRSPAQSTPHVVAVCPEEPHISGRESRFAAPSQIRVPRSLGTQAPIPLRRRRSQRAEGPMSGAASEPRRKGAGRFWCARGAYPLAWPGRSHPGETCL